MKCPLPKKPLFPKPKWLAETPPSWGPKGPFFGLGPLHRSNFEKYTFNKSGFEAVGVVILIHAVGFHIFGELVTLNELAQGLAKGLANVVL